MPSKYDAPCSVCGQMLPGSPSSLPAGQRTCHRCRRVRREEAQTLAAAAPRPPRKPPEKTARRCLCGAEFMGFPSAKYCSPDCRPRYVQVANGPPCIEPGCDKPSRKRFMCCTHYNRRYQPNRARGTSIKDWTRQNPERAAAQQERKRRRRRARQREAVSEPYTLMEIATRDGFTCQLCRKRVDMTKPHPHPKSPSIDHKVPLSESLDDTKANVQLAHFDCNWRKGARGGPEQLALFG